MAWIAGVGGLIGAVGGLAGGLAYLDQRKDRRHREALNHIPPEIRPLLLDICDVARTLEQRAKPATWIRENVKPLYEQWETLAHVAVSAMKGDHLDFAEVSVRLNRLVLEPVPHLESDPVGYSEAVARQGRDAHLLLDAATVLLMRLAGQPVPFPKPRPGEDRPPVPQDASPWRRMKRSMRVKRRARTAR